MPDTRAPDPSGSVRFAARLQAIVGVVGVPFLLQTSDAYLAGRASLSTPGGAAVTALVVVSVLVGLVAGLRSGRSPRLFLVAFLLYIAAVLIWPWSITGRVPADPMPWLVAIAPMPCAYLVVAVDRWAPQIAAGFGLAAALALTLSGVAGIGVAGALINAAFVVTVDALLVLLIAGARRSVTNTERAQRAALDGYAEARRTQALDDERVRTDALLHDRVLTTLLSAAAAEADDDRRFAVRMARNALGVLSRAADPSLHGPRVPITHALTDQAAQLGPLLARVDLQLSNVDHVLLPEPVAEAIVSAMVQALSNSVKHAGPRADRRIRVEAFGLDGVRIVVQDDGVGFDPSHVSPERLGVRVSVVERMERIDGRATIESAPGRGTRIVLLWGPDLEITTAHARVAETAVP